MKILQGGAPKCGNLWLYQIVQQVLERSGRPTRSFISQQPIYELARHWDLNYPTQASIDVLDVTDLQYSYRISSIYRMPIQDLAQYVAQTNHVWTHSPVCKRSPELFSHFDKKLYILRDPRDRALSAAKYYTSPYMLKYYPQEERDPQRFLEKNFEQLMLEWVWHVFDHLRLRQEHNIHIVLYEALLHDFQGELERLLHYLQCDLSQAQRQEVEDAMRFSTMQKQNPKHLKKGTSGYWMEQLTDEQQEKAYMIAGPLLRYLHYPAAARQEQSYAKSLPNTDFEKLKQELILSQQPLYA